MATVYVPYFTNETSEYTLVDGLARSLNGAITRDGRLRILSTEVGSSSTLSGRITGYSRTPYSFVTADQVKEYAVRITVAWTFTDKATGKTLTSATAQSASTTYRADDAVGETAARDQALIKLGDDIVSQMTSVW